MIRKPGGRLWHSYETVRRRAGKPILPMRGAAFAIWPIEGHDGASHGRHGR